MAGSFLKEWEPVIKQEPLDGFIMEPSVPWARQAAQIICGHQFVQERLFDAEQDAFENFVLEVIRTTAPTR